MDLDLQELGTMGGATPIVFPPQGDACSVPILDYDLTTHTMEITSTSISCDQSFDGINCFKNSTPLLREQYLASILAIDLQTQTFLERKFQKIMISTFS
jgi:hypothetical protein